MLWRKERQIYKRLKQQLNDHTDRRIELVVCPQCQVLQKIGQEACVSCQTEWVVCQVCLIPFGEGESVVIAPCCGLGFHRDHFESEVRALGHCPSCESIEVLEESNW